MITNRLVCFAIAAVSVATTFNAVADGSGSGANSWIGYVFGGNLATTPSSAVAAGSNNVASGQGAFVGAGTANQANGISSLVIGGFDNRAVAIDALVGAGAGNRATGVRSVIVGGGYNLASGHFSFIGGGGRDGTGSTPAGTDPLRDNRAFGKWGFVGAGHGNVAGQSGSPNVFTDNAVVAGVRNVASGHQAFIGGGSCNTASGQGSVVVGGGAESAQCYDGNIASGNGSFIGGGYRNTVSGVSSTIPGGSDNEATGGWSFAAGAKATANANGCFVWSDVSSGGAVSCNAENRFVVRSVGGIFMFTGGTTQATYTGAVLPPGATAWVVGSDRTGKENLQGVNTKEILSKVAALPIATWNWKSQDASIRHMGPMAQDFSEAFGLGESPKGISTVDADGVALAAIQGLHQLVQEKDAQIAALVIDAKIQREEVAELRRAVEVLLARSSLDAQIAQR